jgi:hypothetical protein
MTDKIILELTLDELKVIDKHIEYNDETQSVFDKIKYAYPQLKMTLINEGEYAVVSYNNTTYYRLMREDSTCFGWYIKKGGSANYLTPTLVIVTDGETDQLLEGLYYNDIVVKKQKEPEENEWKSVALRFGEELVDILPCGYYEFTPEEWFDWVVNTYEKLCDDTVNLLTKKTAQERGEKLHEENPGKSVEHYLTPKTPEETEQSLKEAFVEAQKTEKWKRIQQKIDDGYFNDFIFIDRPNLLDFLKDKLGYSTDSCYEIVDAISEWLPETQSADGSQNAYVESAVEGWNDAINAIRGKLQ